MSPETKLMIFAGVVTVLGFWCLYLMEKPRKLPPPVDDHRDTLRFWKNSWRA